jgi:hypothetical protein
MPVIMPEPSDTLHGIVGMSVSSSSSKFIRLSKLQSAAAQRLDTLVSDLKPPR